MQSTRLALAMVLALLACGAGEEAALEAASFSLPGGAANAARGWATSGPEAQLVAEGVVAVIAEPEPGGASVGWHFIAPRRVVDLGLALYGCSVAFAIEYPGPCRDLHSAPRARIVPRNAPSPEVDPDIPLSDSAPQRRKPTEYDVLFSGAGMLVAAKASPGMRVRIHEEWNWVDVSTGEPVGRQKLSAVLSALDAVLLRPRPCEPETESPTHVVLRQFVVSRNAHGDTFKGENEGERGSSDGPTTARKGWVGVGEDINPAGRGGKVRQDGKGCQVTRGHVQAGQGIAGITLGLQACDTMYMDREWPRALECYHSVLPDLVPDGAVAIPLSSSSAAAAAVAAAARAWGGERVCWTLLRSVRMRMMLSKLPLNETLSSLEAAANATVEEHEASEGDASRRASSQQGPAPSAGLGGGVEVASCMAWVHKTRGDALFRDRQYPRAASAYRRALAHEVGDVAVTAILGSDLAAAAHLSGAGNGSPADYHQHVAVHYARAAQMLPSLGAHQILGTLGTYSFGEEARAAIQAQLVELAAKQAGAPPCPWHARLEAFLEERRARLGRARAHASCKQAVYFFCRLRGQTPGTADQAWGPSSVVRGLGGSEEAAVYVSRELVKRGYCVRVYGNPNPEEYGVDEHGVEWLPFWAFRQADAPDVAVLWRNFDSVWLAPRAARRYLWVHDPLALASDQDYFTDDFLGALAAILVLSNHSRSQFPAHAQPKLVLSANGLAEHLLRDGPNRHHQLLYSSWPSSGLEEVLREWGRIRDAAPDAQLHVYGGFDWWWATPLYQDQAWFKSWRAEMETLLLQPGVKYWGAVGHQVLPPPATLSTPDLHPPPSTLHPPPSTLHLHLRLVVLRRRRRLGAGEGRGSESSWSESRGRCCHTMRI